MPLKLTVDSLDSIPEALRGSYKQRSDGAGFILDVEGGVVAKSVHDEFRTRNIELQNKLKAFGDLTPDAVTELQGKIDALTGDLDKARKGKDADAEARIKAVQDGYQKQIDELTKGRDGYKSRLENVLIDSQVAKIAAEIGAHPQALDDIAARVRPRFRVGDDNAAFAVDEQGNKVYGEDGKPLGIDGAVRQLVKTAPHLFKSSSGGGASNDPAGGGHQTTANPWAKKSWNVTEQMRITQKDPASAKRMEAEAKSAG